MIVSGWSDMQSSFFYRLIWLGLISAFIPIILAGTVYYQVSVNNAYEETEEESRISMKFVMDRVEAMLVGIESESLQVASNPAISELLSNYSNTSDSYLLHKQVLTALDRKKNTNDMIGDIILYHNQSKTLFSTYYGTMKLDNYSSAGDIQTALNLVSGGAQWLYLPEAAKNGYISFVFKLPLMTKNSLTAA
jgi:two-component system response regulator YesN